MTHVPARLESRLQSSQKGPKSVVLIDPSTDDGMLPVIASGSMSKGAVTVYPSVSDGPLHPIAPLVPSAGRTPKFNARL